MQVYELYLQSDVCYPCGLRWWFHFSVTNLEPDVPYEFRIVNMQRKESFFSAGMQPVAYSVAEGRWQRVGKDVRYHPTPLLPSQRLAALDAEMHATTAAAASESKLGDAGDAVKVAMKRTKRAAGDVTNWRAVHAVLMSRNRVAGLEAVASEYVASHAATAAHDRAAVKHPSPTKHAVSAVPLSCRV